MSKRIRLKIEACFPTNSRGGLAISYLHIAEADKKMRFEQAIACLYAPLGAALTERSISEVQKQIEISRNQFETFMQMALNLCALEEEGMDSERTQQPNYQPFNNGNSNGNGNGHGHNTNIEEISMVQTPFPSENLTSPEEYLDLDNEEL